MIVDRAARWRHSFKLLRERAIVQKSELDTVEFASGMMKIAIAELARRKNVPLIEGEAESIADAMLPAFTPDELAVFAECATGVPSSVILEANRRLDRRAIVDLIRTSERTGCRRPLDPKDTEALVDETVSALGLDKPGAGIYVWPEVAVWEQMAASRFGKPIANLDAFADYLAQVGDKR